jgi:hypothetical protein
MVVVRKRPCGGERATVLSSGLVNQQLSIDPNPAHDESSWLSRHAQCDGVWHSAVLSNGSLTLPEPTVSLRNHSAFHTASRR